MPAGDNTARSIVELLLNHGELSLPQICDLLDANTGTIDYHLKVLMKKDIIRSKGKKYKTKYCIIEEKISIPKSVVWEFSASLAFLVLGVLMLVNQLLLGAATFFLISSIIGTAVIFFNANERKKEKIRDLLAML